MAIAPPVYDMGENTHDTGDGGVEQEPDRGDEHIEFQYEVAEKYALVQEGRMAVALLPDMESAREFVERSDRYSMETPPGSNVVSIQYPVHVLDEVSADV